MEKFIIWYMKPEWFRFGIMGMTPMGAVEDTHVRVTEVEVEMAANRKTLDFVYGLMQAEHWSPNGEARPLIEKLGLQHTSMSVGDIIQHGETFYLVGNFGFEDLKQAQAEEHNRTRLI